MGNASRLIPLRSNIKAELLAFERTRRRQGTEWIFLKMHASRRFDSDLRLQYSLITQRVDVNYSPTTRLTRF
jgi:hypothetical protein